MERPSHVRRLAMNVPQRWWFVMVCCTSPLGFMFWFILMFLWCFFFLLFWSMMFEGVDMAPTLRALLIGGRSLLPIGSSPLGDRHCLTAGGFTELGFVNSILTCWPWETHTLHIIHLNSSSLHLVPKQVGRTIRSSTSQAWVRFRISTASLWDFPSMLGIFPSAGVKVGKAFAKLWWCCLPAS